MPKQRETYSRDGILDFLVTKRQGNVYLLVGTYRHSPTLHTYEVHRLRMKPAHPDSPDAGRLILCSPSESEWGKHGFTYMSLEDAQKKFEALAGEARLVAASIMD